MDRTETLLIADLCEGDETALAPLVERYKRMVYRLAVQITKNHADADDVMQETFIKSLPINSHIPEGCRFRDMALPDSRERGTQLCQA